jgi:hypothetical protein
MNARGIIFVLVLGLSGFVAAEFLVTGICYGTPSPAVFQVLNGNCIKGEDKYYEMVTLATI